MDSMMAWQMLAFVIFSLLSLQPINCVDPGNHGIVLRADQHYEINRIKLAISQSLTEFDEFYKGYKAANPEKKEDETEQKDDKKPKGFDSLPFMARMAIKFATSLHSGTKSIFDILTRAEKQKAIAPKSFMEFAKFYAKFIVGFSEILIEEMVEGTFNKIKPLSYSEGEIVRGLIKEITDRIEEITLWQELRDDSKRKSDGETQQNAKATTRQLDAVVDVRLIDDLRSKIDKSTDVNAKIRMQKTLERGDKAAKVLTHLLFMEQMVALQKEFVHKTYKERQEAQKRAGTSSSDDATHKKTQKKAGTSAIDDPLAQFDEPVSFPTEWTKSMKIYQYNIYFETGLINGLRSLFMGKESAKFIEILRENVEGKWAKKWWHFGGDKKKKREPSLAELASKVEKIFGDGGSEQNQGGYGTSNWATQMYSLGNEMLHKKKEKPSSSLPSATKKMQPVRNQPDSSALTIVEQKSSALSIYEESNEAVDALGRLSAELLKLVDYWRVLINEFETVPITSALMPVDPDRPSMVLPKYGVDRNVSKMLIWEYEAAKQAVEALTEISEPERAQLNKLIEKIMEVRKMEASGRKVDKLETYQLLFIVHEDKYRPIVAKGKAAHGQEAFGAIERFVLKHGKEATQYLTKLKDLLN